MKYTFSIHGVPYGWQVWGDVHDSEYLKSYYNSVSADMPTQMVVDIRYSGDTICTYYHYLVLSNVSDHKSRPGSYFGLTLCFEGVYCTNFALLYKLFNQCFEKVVLSTVMSKTQDGYKYMLPDFDSTESIERLTKVSAAIGNNMHNFEESLIAFPKGYEPKHREDNILEKWSTEDIGNKTFERVLLRDAMVSISPSYPVTQKKVDILQDENVKKDKNIQKLESEKQTLEGENSALKGQIAKQTEDINARNNTISQQKGVIEGQKNDIGKLQSDNAHLHDALDSVKVQVKKLQAELHEARNNQDDEKLSKCYAVLKDIAERRSKTDALIDAMSPKLQDAKAKIKEIDQQLNGKKGFKLKPIHLLIGLNLILLVLTIVAIVMVMSGRGEGNPDKPTPGSHYAYVTTAEEQRMINAEVSPIEKSLKTIKDEVISKSVDVSTGSDIEYDGSQVVSIPIGGRYDTEYSPGREYALTAKKRNSSGEKIELEHGGGEFRVFWKDTSGEKIIHLMSNDNGKTSKLQIAEDWPDEFYLQYVFNGTVIKERTIKKQQNGTWKHINL